MPTRRKNNDLQSYLAVLEKRGELVRITEKVSVKHEMTEIHKRVLESGGPVLLFEKPVLANGTVSDIPVVVNLFGTSARVADALNCKTDEFQTVGEWMAQMKQPSPPSGLRDMLGKVPMLTGAMAMNPEILRKGQIAPCQEIVLTGEDIDLTKLPIQTNWSGEIAPLITWPLNITRAPDSEETQHYNMGVYRMQVLGKNKLIARWMTHRGGAKHHRGWAAQGEDMPMAVAIGADPATIMAAVTPVPDALSEYHFAGLLRGAKLKLVPAKTVPLLVPANAEIILEGFVSATETADEGPYGDHTGYYNAVEPFPVFTVTAITRRENPVYLSTYTGRSPDEPSVISACLNDVYVPLLKQQFPEVVDCYLPPEACSYRIGVVSIKKGYAGHARRIMMGLWSHLTQFSYTKLIIVVDEDINVRDWKDVMWAVSTRSDAGRDVMIVDNTPIDYLDFASPVEGLGAKMGIDATHKIDGETSRDWGTVLKMDDDVVSRIDALWEKLGL